MTGGIRLQLKGELSDFSFEADLSLPLDGITGIFGDSGSGKTTLLRAIAGFEPGIRGRVEVNGEVWQSDSFFLPPHLRSVGFVFQEPSLFSHLDVCGNLAFGWNRTPVSLRRGDWNEVVGMLSLEPLLSRRTEKLSGGERQRVALARALLASPRLLLMDEPLASLDLRARNEILPYLRRVHEKFGMPIFHVTHAREELLALADRMVQVEKGKCRVSVDF